MAAFLDIRKIASFSIIGGLVALIYVILYFGFSRTAMPAWIANTLAFAIAVAFQYLAQTKVTFRKRIANTGQQVRFLIMVTIGLAYSNLVVIANTHANICDAVCVSSFVAITLPVMNFILMQLWVYRDATGE